MSLNRRYSVIIWCEFPVRCDCGRRVLYLTRGLAAMGSITPPAWFWSPGQAPRSADRLSRPAELGQMVIDARWKTNARAVIMHMEQAGTRFLWFGFEPDAVPHDDRQLLVLLRTALRWVAGQPVSEGAIGPAQIAKTLTPGARRQAQAMRFVFTVDPLPNRKVLSVACLLSRPRLAPDENRVMKLKIVDVRLRGTTTK